MKPTEPKAVKAWAVVDETGEIFPEFVYDHIDIDDMRLTLGRNERVIPVTITPGHEAEDENT